MINKILCDTGVISRYLLNEVSIMKTIDDNIGLENIAITPLNRIELLNWLSGYQYLDKPKRARFLRFIKAIPLFHIHEKISKLAIDLPTKNINSKPADTFIAAIAIYHNTPLYTLNKKDFKLLKTPLF